MVTVPSESCEELCHIASNIRLIDKTNQIQRIAEETERINQRVNNYINANPDETKRIKFIHISSIINNGLMDLDVTGLDLIPALTPESISSSMALFNKVCIDLSMESLRDFIDSLHLDIEAMFNIVLKSNKGIV
jgi:hypothetical protein